MSWLAGRLAAGSGRGEVVRVVLVALGATLGTVLLLCAALVTAIQGGFDREVGGELGAAYRTELIDQAGLRPGVVTALVLMLVPVLVFLGMCARISAAQRDRRLAAVRLAGATPGQVRLLAAAETALPAAVGAVIGLLTVLVAKSLLERRYLQTEAGLGLARALPTDVALPPVRTLLVLLLVPALCAGSAVLALRRVEATPLGVSRRAQPAPRAGGFVVLLVGVVVVVGAPLTGQAMLLPFALGALLTMLGLTAAGSWLTAQAGSVAARRARRPALLLAGRRLQADPRAQGRALSGVVLAVLVASGAAVLRAVTLRAQEDDGFYRSAYNLIDLALLVALVVAAAGLLVASCEAVLERRRTLASLAATGVPQATLRRAVLLQSLLPAVPAVALAAVAGATGALALTAAFGDAAVVPWARLLGVVALALLAVAAASAAAAAPRRPPVRAAADVSRTVVLPVRVEGRLLRRLRGELLAHLRADPVLVVEAARVQHLSDAAQAVLVTAHRAAVARGGRVHLHQPSSEVVAALRAKSLWHLLQDTQVHCKAAVPAQNECASTGQP